MTLQENLPGRLTPVSLEAVVDGYHYLITTVDGIGLRYPSVMQFQVIPVPAEGTTHRGFSNGEKFFPEAEVSAVWEIAQ